MGATRKRRKPTDGAWSDRMGQRVTNMVQEWRARSGGAELDDEPPQEDRVHPVRALAASADPYPDLLRWTDSREEPEFRRRVFIGADGGGLVFAPPDQHVLALGRMRSNKTAGTLIGSITAWPGPVVSTSSKPDVLRATAMARSRLGPIWHFSPDGRPHAPGAIPLRWSPLQAAMTWAGALEQAEVMVEAAEAQDKDTRGSIWRRQAPQFLGPMLHATAIDSGVMNDCVQAVVAQDMDAIKRGARVLERGREESQLALHALNSVMRAHPEGQKSIILTAAAALKVYTHPGALKQCESPNFDPAAFVAGEPDVLNEDRYSPTDRAMSVHAHLDSVAERLPKGRYGTVYIASDNPLVKPLVAGLLKAIFRATFDLHDRQEADWS